MVAAAAVFVQNTGTGVGEPEYREQYCIPWESGNG